MKNRQKGLGATEAIIIFFAISIVGLVGWSVYQSRKNNNPLKNDISISNPPSTDPVSPKDDCTKNGIIIVYFNKEVAKDKREEIITKEKAYIKNYWDQFDGYSLNVTLGQEQAFVDSFKKHPEIKSAYLNGCGILH